MDKQGLLKQYASASIKFMQKYPALTMLEYEIGMRQVAIAMALSARNKDFYQAYKQRVEEEIRKERKRRHNKKKSDRMKRLRVKKEKKRA